MSPTARLIAKASAVLSVVTELLFGLRGAGIRSTVRIMKGEAPEKGNSLLR